MDMQCSTFARRVFVMGALVTLVHIHGGMGGQPFSLFGAAHTFDRSGLGKAERLRKELVWLAKRGHLSRSVSNIYTLTRKGARAALRLSLISQRRKQRRMVAA